MRIQDGSSLCLGSRFHEIDGVEGREFPRVLSRDTLALLAIFSRPSLSLGTLLSDRFEAWRTLAYYRGRLATARCDLGQARYQRV